MMQFQNVYYDSLLEKYGSKKMIVYGVGGTFSDFLDLNIERTELLESIDHLIDRDPVKKGQLVQVGPKALRIETLEQYEGKSAMAAEYVMLLCLADQYIQEALKDLDQISAFDGMVCLYGSTALQWGNNDLPLPLPVGMQVLKKPQRQYAIPKTIHYCWFGGREIPEKNLRYMESWERKCPGYTIKLWNENSYPLADTPSYVQEAYQAGKYSFVSDYVRLDVLYKYGGIYLDTDVELFAPLDQFLSYKAFFAFESFNLIGTGLGCGCVEKSEIMLELLRLYEGRRFLLDDGRLDMTPCPYIHTDFFKKKGLEISNKTQIIDDMLFLASDFLCAFDQRRCIYAFTENTVGVHHFDCSWFDQKEKREWEETKEKKHVVNERLLQDFVRTMVK